MPELLRFVQKVLQNTFLLQEVFQKFVDYVYKIMNGFQYCWHENATIFYFSVFVYSSCSTYSFKEIHVR